MYFIFRFEIAYFKYIHLKKKKNADQEYMLITVES